MYISYGRVLEEYTISSLMSCFVALYLSIIDETVK